MACHAIFQRCFLAMFRSNKKRNIHGTSMAALLNSLSADIVAASDDPSCAADHGAAFVVPDVQPSKVEGVRAKKSCLYIERAETLTETFVSLLAPMPIESYMHWLLRAQELEAWLHKDPCERPLINLTSTTHSPVMEALGRLTQSAFEVPVESALLKLMDGTLSFSNYQYQYQSVSVYQYQYQ